MYLFKNRTTQPQYPVKPAQRWVNRGLILAYNGSIDSRFVWTKPGIYFDTTISSFNTYTKRLTSLGYGLDYNGSQETRFWDGTSASNDVLSGVRTITILSCLSLDTTGSERRALGFYGSSSTLFNIETDATAANWRFQVRNTAGSLVAVSGGATQTNTPLVLAASMNGVGGTLSFYTPNGKTTGTGPGGTLSLGSITFGCLDRGGGPEQGWDGWLGDQFVFNQVLTDSEISEIRANPSILWETPQKRIIFFSSSTGYTLSAAYGTYTYTGQSGTLLHNKIITANNGTYSLTGQAATITYTPTGTNYTLVADKGDYTYTGQTATLLRSKLLNAVNGTYSVTGQNANIAYSGSNTITLKAGSWLRYRIIQ